MTIETNPISEPVVAPTDLLAAETPETTNATEAAEQAENTEAPEVESQEAPNPVARRISKLTAKLAAKEREIEVLKQQALPQVPQQAVTANNDAPRIDDYEDIASYTAAVVEHRLQQAQVAQAAQRAQQDYNDRVEAFKKTAPDFREAVSEVLHLVTPAVSEFVMESDIGPALLYHLANHEGEQERFEKMSNTRKVAYLASLETSLKAAKPQRSSLPAPAKKVAATPVSSNAEAGSFQEWKAARLAAKNKR